MPPAHSVQFLCSSWHPLVFWHPDCSWFSSSFSCVFTLWTVTTAVKLKYTAPWKKSYNKPWQCVKKQRHYLPTKVHIVKVMVFLVVMYGCESWIIQKAEPQRNDAFELRCWRRLLRAPWITRRSNQSILKEISHEYSLEAEALILWLPDAKSRFIGKYPDARKD